MSPTAEAALALIGGTLLAPAATLLAAAGLGRVGRTLSSALSPALSPALVAALALALAPALALIGAAGLGELTRLGARSWWALAPLALYLGALRAPALGALGALGGAWLIVSSHAGLMGEGAALALARGWVLEPAALGLAVGVALWRLAARPEEGGAEEGGAEEGGADEGGAARALHPLALPAGLALSYGAAAGALAASGSASAGQLLGSVGLSVAAIGLWGWRAGAAGGSLAAAVSYAPLPLAALYAHHFLSPALPTPIAAALVALPLPLALAPRGWWAGGAARQVGVALALVGAAAALAGGLVAAVELARAAAAAADPYGGGYGY